jgi:hypothetical protein
MCNSGMQATCGPVLSRTLLGDHLGLGAMTTGIFTDPGVTDLVGSFDSDLGASDTGRVGAETSQPTLTTPPSTANSPAAGNPSPPSPSYCSPTVKPEPIATLRPGDKVLATNTRTGKTGPETVAAVLVHPDTNLYNLTSNHLFWDAAVHQWVKASALGHWGRLCPPQALR